MVVLVLLVLSLLQFLSLLLVAP
eukprot:COSAG03_NODE_23001_length_284_cov_0.962162_1_plen_22_part_10